MRTSSIIWPLVFAACIACGGSDGSVTQPPAVAAVAKVTLTPVTSPLAPGGQLQFIATVADASGATLSGRKVTWASSSAAVMTVDVNTGVGIAIADGTATITGTSEGISGTTAVVVSTPSLPVATVAVSPGPVKLAIGMLQQLTAVAKNANGGTLTGRTVAWSSSDAGVASVTASGGLVTAVADGTATITATSEGRTGVVTITVTAFVPSSISSSGAHTCALTTAGAAYCWGKGDVGALGNGTAGATGTSSVPVAVSGGLVFQSIAALGDHTIALTPAGAAYAWGANYAGQLGDGTTTQRLTPVAVAGGHLFRAVAGGYQHSLGLTTDGAVYSWGTNQFGQLGDGTTVDRSTPVAVVGGRSYMAIGAGDYHSVALTTSGAAYGWGHNGFGQLGDGSAGNLRTSPVAAAGNRVFRSINAGGHTTVALDANGVAYAWGANNFGQLGDGTKNDRQAPTPVSGALTFRGICTGGRHTVALAATGAAYAWGDNGFNQLGNGTSVDGSGENRLSPGGVSGGQTFTAISCAIFHTVALTPAGAASGWGHNPFGQMGDGTTTSRSTPITAVGGMIFK